MAAMALGVASALGHPAVPGESLGALTLTDGFLGSADALAFSPRYGTW